MMVFWFGGYARKQSAVVLVPSLSSPQQILVASWSDGGLYVLKDELLTSGRSCTCNMKELDDVQIKCGGGTPLSFCWPTLASGQQLNHLDEIKGLYAVLTVLRSGLCEGQRNGLNATSIIALEPGIRQGCRDWKHLEIGPKGLARSIYLEHSSRCGAENTIKKSTRHDPKKLRDEQTSGAGGIERPHLSSGMQDKLDRLREHYTLWAHAGFEETLSSSHMLLGTISLQIHDVSVNRPLFG
nr:hypothetical protein Iba_chr01eCG5490 [Ipomoea batatas]